MERMTVPIEWKSVGDDSGTLEGYASTFGNVDLGGDVVVKGAFRKTIANIKATGIPLLADHNATTASVLGTIFDAEEDSVGLKIKASISAAASAQDVRTKLIEGHLNRMSIGYEPVKTAYKQQDGKTVRLLQEIDLWETSIVVFPMNPSAAVQRVKSAAQKTYEDLRKRLNNVLREAYGGDKIDVWVRDFDDTKVWFEIWEEDEGSHTFEQSYTASDDTVTLDGDRVKVRVVITYMPDEGTKNSPASSGDAKARHATAPEDTKTEVAPAGSLDEVTSWDPWVSEAVLAGTDGPAEPVGSPDRLKTETSLEYMRQFLAQHSLTTEQE